jgi:hypothetical protein
MDHSSSSVLVPRTKQPDTVCGVKGTVYMEHCGSHVFLCIFLLRRPLTPFRHQDVPLSPACRVWAADVPEGKGLVWHAR